MVDFVLTVLVILGATFDFEVEVEAACVNGFI